MRTMKRYTAVMLAGTVLAGCSWTEPGITFKSGDFECSKVGAKFEINPKIADILLETLKTNNATRHPELKNVAPLMNACLLFLSNKPVTAAQ